MTVPRQILNDLREKRLWPVAVVLILALVAVPTLLAKSASQTPIAQLPQSPSSAAGPTTAVPAVNVQTTTSSHLKGHGHNPFIQQKLPAAKSTASSTKTTTTSTAGSTGTKTSGGSTATTGTGTGGSGTGSGSTPPAGLPTSKPKPAPAGLTATQAYSVSIAITNSAGGFDRVDSLPRLSPLPNRQQPLLIELGVLRGGRRVLFAIQPGTVVRGGGTCVPGPVDCQLISVAPGTEESIFRPAVSAVAVAQYTVTAIGVDRYGSAAAADKARRTESAAGRRLVNSSTLNALSLFQYDARLGAVVDLRNLDIGGN